MEVLDLEDTTEKVEAPVDGPQNYNRAEAEEACKLSLDYLAGLVLGDAYMYAFPKTLLSFWHALIDSVVNVAPKSFPKLAIGIPRGHAKSTLIKLFAVWCILFTQKKFIIVICASDELAENMVNDIAAMLDTDNIVSLFGDWRAEQSTDRGAKKKFFFRGRNIIIKGVGQGASTRGINENNARPDIIIFDDSQTKEGAQSIAESTNYINWFSSTLKIKSPHGTAFIYIGNMYKELVLKRNMDDTPKLRACMLHNLSEMGGWKSFIAGALLSDGGVIWEELHPKEVLLAELADDIQLGTEEEWYAEVQNEPKFSKDLKLDMGKCLIVDSAAHKHISPEARYKYIVIDPSLGKKKSDDQVVGLFEVFDDLIPIWTKAKKFQVSQPKLVSAVLDWAVEENVALVCSEDYGMQAAIVQWFEEEKQRRELHNIQFIGINRGKMAKNVGIQNYFKHLHAQEQGLSPEVASYINTQADTFDVTVMSNKDDYLDVGYYGIKVWADQELRAKAEVINSTQAILDQIRNQMQSGLASQPSGEWTRG